VVPLASISSTHCGYTKPFGALLLGVVSLLGALGGLFQSESPVFVIGIVLAGICFSAYWLMKKIAITIETAGGMTLGLAFKRSLIENVAVDIDEAVRAINLLNQRVVAQQAGPAPARVARAV
jgi:hypothetical protein